MQVQGTLQRRNRSWPITGRIQGARLSTQETEVGQLELQHEGGRLVITGGRGPLALLRGMGFVAAPAGRCG